MASFKRCYVGMEIQSVLFPKTKFTASSSQSWMKSHGYHTTKMDETENYYRYRQRSPKSFKRGSFRIITLGKTNVRAIVACPKLGQESDKSKKRKMRDRVTVHEAISNFRKIPRTGRSYERAQKLR